jgi:hypothetical protein
VVALAARVAWVEVGGMACLPWAVTFRACVWWERTGNVEAGVPVGAEVPAGEVEVDRGVGPLVAPCCGAAVAGAVGPAVGWLVGRLVGWLGGWLVGDEGEWDLGATPGGAWALPCCQDRATYPPAGTLSEVAPTDA